MFDLKDRTGGARVLVADLSFTDSFGHAPGFLIDTDSQPDDESALRLAIQAFTTASSVTKIDDDELTFAMPLYDGNDVSASSSRSAA